LTATEAKRYALSYLPCTMRAVEELFELDLGHHIFLDKLVGMRPGSLGYSTLVFYFRHCVHQKREIGTEAREREYLKWWFENKLNGAVGPYSKIGLIDQVWWVRVPVEIKEDREGLPLKARRIVTVKAP
jgi:hypothetical protein